DRELQHSLEQAKADLELAWDLDRVRQKALTLVEGKRDPGRVRARYPELLAEHRLNVLEGDLDELAEVIRASAGRENLVAALDDWAARESNPPGRQRLLRLANRSDESDPWRQAVRQALAQGDRRRLGQLVKGTGQGRLTPGVVLLLAQAFPDKSPEV